MNARAFNQTSYPDWYKSGSHIIYLKHAASSMPHHIVYPNDTDADYAMI